MCSVVTEIPGKPVGPTFNSKKVAEIPLDCLTSEDETDRLSCNVLKVLPNYSA